MLIWRSLSGESWRRTSFKTSLLREYRYSHNYKNRWCANRSYSSRPSFQQIVLFIQCIQESDTSITKSTFVCKPRQNVYFIKTHRTGNNYNNIGKKYLWFYKLSLGKINIVCNILLRRARNYHTLVVRAMKLFKDQITWIIHY